MPIDLHFLQFSTIYSFYDLHFLRSTIFLPFFVSFSVNVIHSPDGGHNHAQVCQSVPKLGKIIINLKIFLNSKREVFKNAVKINL